MAAARAELDRRRRTREWLRGEADAEHDRLMSVGKPGRAVVVDFKLLGLRMAPETQTPKRMTEVSLSIEGEGGATTGVTVVDMVPEPYLARLLKGATLPVRVDPDDPQKVAIVWDTP